MSNSKVCAYCDGPGPFTKDHVWPKCFLERSGQGYARFSVRSQRVHGADYVVRDVCRRCNNDILSAVDTYFCLLNDQYFRHVQDFGATVTLEYDFDLLARALTKIAYNSARAGTSDASPLAEIRGYILGRDARPVNLAIFAELVSPTLIQDQSGPITVARKIFPTMFRSALTQLHTPSGQLVQSRIIAVNSFYFHLLLPKRLMLPRDFEAAADELAMSVPGTVRAEPLAASLELRTSPQDGVTSFLPHLEEFRDQYSRHFERLKGSERPPTE